MLGIGALDDSVGWILTGDKVSHSITHLEDSWLDCTVHFLGQFAFGAVYDAGFDLTKRFSCGRTGSVAYQA